MQLDVTVSAPSPKLAVTMSSTVLLVVLLLTNLQWVVHGQGMLICICISKGKRRYFAR